MNKDTVFLTHMSLFNLGCEGIVRGTIKILRHQINPHFKFMLPSFYPIQDKKRLDDINNVEVIPMKIWRRAFRLILRKTGLYPDVWISNFSFLSNKKRITAVFSVGGDLFTLFHGYIPWDLIKLGDACFKHDVPFVTWGATMEAFENKPELIPKLMEHLNNATLITVRDARTVKYLADHGIEDNVKMVADPAFCMDPIECNIEPFLPLKRNKLIVGLNLSPFAEKQYPKKNLIQQAAWGIEKLIEEISCSVVLVSHVLSPKSLPGYDDREFLNKIYHEIKDQYRNFVSQANIDLGAPRMKYLISQLDVFAGSRMHSTIASLSSGVPTLIIAYSEKGKALNDLLYDHENWLLPVEKFTAESFCEKMIQLCENHKYIKDNLSSTIPKLQEQAMLGGQYCRDILIQSN